MSDMKAWETERMYQTRREAEHPTEEDIENEEIERQIEYVEECQRGENGDLAQDYSSLYGTMHNFHIYERMQK